MKRAAHILVPTDFSECSLKALDQAVSIARAFDAHIHVVHVLDDVAVRGLSAEAGVAGDLSREALTKEAHGKFAALAPRFEGVAHDLSVRIGKPEDEIVTFARKLPADVIVIATHGRRGLARFFIGSTTEAVVRRAPCPVLSVHPAHFDEVATTEPSSHGRTPVPLPPHHLPLKVRDVMRRDVLTVRPDTNVRSILRTMIRHDLSGLPVVDEQDNLVGYVPESHLLRRTLATVSDPSALERAASAEEFVDMQRLLHGRTAREVMCHKHDVVTVDESVELPEAVALMLNRKVSRMPVMRGERVVGYVTRADILRAILEAEEEKQAHGTSDREIDRMVLHALHKASDVDIDDVAIHTEDGVVRLSGTIGTMEQGRILEEMVAKIPGVKSVANFLLVERLLH